MKHRVSYAIIGLAVVVLFYFSWKVTKSSPSFVVKKDVKSSENQFKRMPERTRPTVPQKSLTESEMRELVSVFANEPSHTASNTEILVFPGESVYTTAYESQPGHFAFTHVTPKLIKATNGKDMVQVKVESIEMSIEGGIRTFVPRSVDVRPGNDQDVMVGYEDGVHVFSIQIGKESNELGIAMKLQTSYIPKPR